MPFYKLDYVAVRDDKLDQIVEAISIDRPPPTGSLSTQLTTSERKLGPTSPSNCCHIIKDVRVLTMDAELMEMYNTTPGMSSGRFVTRQHLAGLVTHMTAMGWTFEDKKYLGRGWVSYNA